MGIGCVALIVVLVGLGSYIESRKKKTAADSSGGGEAATTTAPAPGSGGGEAQVRDLMGKLTTTMNGRSYVKDSEYYNTLKPQESANLDVRMQAGAHFVLAGFCDGSCRNIDVWLYDRNGRLLASDTQVDDQPVVQLTSPHSGTYRLRVKMVRCEGFLCHYGIGLFRRTAP